MSDAGGEMEVEGMVGADAGGEAGGGDEMELDGEEGEEKEEVAEEVKDGERGARRHASCAEGVRR